jgi:hypothetical protein
MENIGTIVLATGALGTAAFGIVEALKWTSLGFFGFPQLKANLGPIWATLQTAYGRDFEQVLRGQYKGSHQDLVKTLRQGVRVGLTEEQAETIAAYLGLGASEKLKAAAAQIQLGGTLPNDLRDVLGRFELAVDARIDAAMALAQNHYAGKMRVAALLVSMLIALSVGIYLNQYFLATVVGIAAVPLAPIAKDLTTALQAASQALSRSS